MNRLGEIRGVAKNYTEKRFRKLAMKKFCYGRGSLSKALEAALRQWIQASDFVDPDEPVH